MKTMLALSTWLYSSQTLEEALPKIAKAGFHQIELWADQSHLDPRIKPDLKQTQKLVADYRINIHSIHAPFHGLFIGTKDPSKLEITESCLVKSLEYASCLAAKILVVHPLTFNFKTGSDTCLESTQELMARLVTLADNEGVKIAIENLPTAPVAYTSLVNLAELFPDPRIGFCIDIGHSQLHHINILDEISAIGPRLVSSHISNNDGLRDLHNLPNEGVIDVHSVMKELTSRNIPQVFEINGHQTPDQILQGLRAFTEKE